MSRSLVCLFSALFLLSACSSTDKDPYDQGIYDPLEGGNRQVFAFNQGVDKAVINPTIKGYRKVVPKEARTGLHNFLIHLKSPVTFANQALQGDVAGARDVALRATINTFVGFGGIMDTAAAEGIPYEAEDFGQTLAVWGVGHGPYVVIPFMGGVSTRDGTGFIVDALADPLRIYADNVDEDHWNYYRAGATYVDFRNELYDVLRDLSTSAFDPYAAVRSAYYQRRAAQVADNKVDQVSNPTSEFDEFY